MVAAGGTPYGTDAMHVLRAEKGYIIVGQETDGTVTPDDFGPRLGDRPAKPDFVGKRSLARAEMRGRTASSWWACCRAPAPPRKGRSSSPRQDSLIPLGHVTSSYPDTTLGRPIALGLLAGGRGRIGGTVLALGATGAPLVLDVVAPVFHDPEGARLHG